MTPFVVASVDFSLNLFRAASEPERNAFLSPASISVSLAMAYAGADGGTATQIKEVLFREMESTQIHDAMSQVVGLLTESNELYFANRIYGQEGYNLKQEFVSMLANCYKNEFHKVDFKGNSDSIQHEIKQWVKESTKERISDISVPLWGMPSERELLLVNAVYFTGEWKHKFSKQNTTEGKFYCSPNKRTKVQMMRQQETFAYYENSEMQVVGMPYKADNFTMFVLLSQDTYGLGTLEKELTGEKLLEIIERTRMQPVDVQLPQLKLQHSCSLRQSLETIGLTRMFDGEKADFNKITDSPKLFVSDVIHKTSTEINEEGTSADDKETHCATVSLTSEHETKEFTADHPFFFVIFDHQTESLLFTGRYSP